MIKLNIKNLTRTVFLGMFLFGVITGANAQQTLPKGGDSYETAVKLELGNYQREAMEEKEYFYVDVKAGQEINIKYTFGVGTGRDGWGILFLYDEDRTNLVDKWDAVSENDLKSITISWLSNSEKDSYKYYIKAGYDYGYDVSSVSFDISLTDRYDTGSQTDAGNTFEKAMSITAGNYTAYLSGKEGTDTKDFYKVGIKKEEKLTIKITPPTEAKPSLKIYNSDRVVIKEEYAPNPGAIIQASLTTKKSEDLFVKVSCDSWCSKNLVKYALNIGIQPPPEVETPVEEEIAPDGTSSEEVPPKETPFEQLSENKQVEKEMPLEIEEGLPFTEEIVAAQVVPTKGPNWTLILAIIGIIAAIGVVIYFLFKRCKKGLKLNRITIFLFILLIIFLLIGTWLYFYISQKNDTAIYDRSSEFVYTKILKVISLTPDLVLVVTENPKGPAELGPTGIYNFDAVFAATENPDDTDSSLEVIVTEKELIKLYDKKILGFYVRIGGLQGDVEKANERYIFKFRGLKYLKLLFEEGYLDKVDVGFFYPDLFVTEEGRTKAFIFAHTFITFKHELTHHRFATDPLYQQEVIGKWRRLENENKKKIIMALIKRDYSFGREIDLKEWKKLDEGQRNKKIEELIKKGERLYEFIEKGENLHELIQKNKEMEEVILKNRSLVIAIDEWIAHCNEDNKYDAFEGGIDVMQDITQKDGVWDKHWYNLVDKNGKELFYNDSNDDETYKKYRDKHPEKFRTTEKQPKREEDIQEPEIFNELDANKYYSIHGTCPPGYELVEYPGERDIPGPTYAEATRRLEEAGKRLEEAPKNDPEAIIRAIKELNEATLLYHHGRRCEKQK
ncbi:MAG: hypothetical protein ACKKMS_02100 [Candidatus Nealsonbacteria bacterium]